MGVVFKVRHTRLRRVEALKLILPDELLQTAPIALLARSWSSGQR